MVLQVVNMFMDDKLLTWLRLEVFGLHSVGKFIWLTALERGPCAWGMIRALRQQVLSLFDRSLTRLWQLGARSWRLHWHGFVASLVQMHLLYAFWPAMRHTSDKQVALRTCAA